MPLIRRPLVWLISSFIFGVFCRYYIKSILIISLLVLLCFIVSFLIFQFLKYHYKEKANQDKFILLLAIFFLLGIVVMGKQQSQNLHILEEEEEIPSIAQGIVSQVLEKGKYQEVYLKDVLLTWDKLDETKEKVKKKAYIECLLVYDEEGMELIKGQGVKVKGKLSVFPAPSNLGQYDEKKYYAAKNVNYRMKNCKFLKMEVPNNIINIFLHHLKRRWKKTYQKILNENDAGIMCAMVLGDKSELSKDVKTLYQKSGISHILAISGLHISMIGMLLFSLLKKAGIHHTVASLLAVFLIYLYGNLTGFGVSTNRAVVMMMLSLMGNLFGKTYDSITAIFLSAFLILVQQPLQLFQCGFLLSFLAVFGAVVFYPSCKDYITFCFKKYNEKMKLRSKMEIHSFGVFAYRGVCSIGQSLLMSSAIQCVTLPIIFWFYYETPVLAPVINLFILPLTSLLMILGLTAAVIGTICLPLGFFLAGGIHYILAFYEWICNMFQKIPNSIYIAGMPMPFQIFLVYALLLSFVWMVKNHPKKEGAVLLLASMVLLFVRFPIKGMEVTMLDVGQGDGICIQVEEGLNITIDGGSSSVSNVGTFRIIPFLKAKGIRNIDCCFLTHMDADHINGIQEVLAQTKEPGGIKVKQVVFPYTNAVDDTYKKMVMLAGKSGAKVSYMKAGDRKKKGFLCLKCLHPNKEFHANSTNAYSLVLEISYGGFRMISTGDVEEDGEQQMIANNVFSYSDYDILKLAHHGSKYSNSEPFLNRVNPKFALISSGIKNPYGHPHKEVLNRLSDKTIRWGWTKELGALEIAVRNGNWKVNGFKQKLENSP